MADIFDATVLIEPGRIACAKLGYDVRTTGIDGLAYDSRFASVGETEAGEVILDSRGAGKPNSSIVQLSRTYSNPPIILFGQVGGGGWTEFEFGRSGYPNLFGEIFGTYDDTTKFRPAAAFSIWVPDRASTALDYATATISIRSITITNYTRNRQQPFEKRPTIIRWKTMA